MDKVWVVAAIALVGCGGSGSTIVCSKGTVAGSLMGTFNTCTDFDARYRANLDTFELTADYTELPTSFTWATTWDIPGAPSERTYDQATHDIKCNITMKKGTPTWLSQVGGGVAAAGTCSLVLSDVTELPADGNVTTYKLLKGTIAGHLEASPGTMSTGTVDVTVDFCQGSATDCPQPMP